ncbi:MAG: hypothetical protein ACW99U_19330 [Candidatus Thorarchaeota archaeon]|jgi:hypothetical protein
MEKLVRVGIVKRVPNPDGMCLVDNVRDMSMINRFVAEVLSAGGFNFGDFGYSYPSGDFSEWGLFERCKPTTWFLDITGSNNLSAAEKKGLLNIVLEQIDRDRNVQEGYVMVAVEGTPTTLPDAPPQTDDRIQSEFTQGESDVNYVAIGIGVAAVTGLIVYALRRQR